MKGKTPNKLMKIAGPGTKSVWGGEMGKFPDGATQVPVVNSVTFAYEDLDSWFEVAIGKKEGHIYSRNMPNRPPVSRQGWQPLAARYIPCLYRAIVLSQ